MSGGGGGGGGWGGALDTIIDLEVGQRAEAKSEEAARGVRTDAVDGGEEGEGAEALGGLYRFCGEG